MDRTAAGRKLSFDMDRAAQAVDTCSSSGPRRDVDELHDDYHPSMLSIGTIGICQGRGDELERMQKELTCSSKAVITTTEEDEEDRRRHLTPNGGIPRHRSFRKLVSSVLSGFLPRQIFRGATPELRPTEISPWPLLHNDTPVDNLVISEARVKSFRTAHLPWRGSAMWAEQGSKWIRTDSEYIVLEI